jgi:pathogenesis-related protein 1
MRRDLFAFFFVIAACGGGGGDQIDADRNRPDADPNAPDADPNAPDADPNAPDANPNAPDATPNVPDAQPMTPDAPGGIGEPPELAGITLAHNQVRAGIATSPGLVPLVWNEDLEATAAAWAAQCVDNTAPIGLIDHNPNRSVGHPYYVGENIYGGSAQPTPQQVVNLWVSEAANYDYPSNTCTGVCGHYTQVVWRETLEIGCAIHDCPGLTYHWGVVCDYGPGGNDGSQPY